MHIKSLFCLAALPFFFSCNNSTETKKVENSSDTLVNRLESKIDTIKENYQDFRDETFVTNAFDANREELLKIDLAIKKGTRADVKKTARKMKADHEKLSATLKKYADAHAIKYNTDEIHDNLETMEEGKDWDDEWISSVTKEHEKLRNKFETKQENANDAGLQKIVTSTIPVIHKHLEMMKAL